MGDTTEIGWCDKTFNGWIGCTKVSPGCANCYAEEYANRWDRAKWGKGQPRSRTSEANWRKPLAWNRQAEREGVRFKVFCASLSDWLDPEVPAEWRMDLYGLIEDTPNLDWLMLTKRADQLYGVCDTDFPNMWIGVTAENQQQWDRRVYMLMSQKYKCRTFVSVEPMLGPIDMGGLSPSWLICGGESGANARDVETKWVQDLRDQCSGQSTAFFFKQWGGLRPKSNGRLLDGREWNEFPKGSI